MYVYIMFKNLSDKYYQENKERLQKIKKFVKDIKIFLTMKKTSQKMKNSSLLSIEKNIIE